MEIWGDNAGVEQSLHLHGVDAWVYARAYRGAKRGGDIHFASTCGHGMIARFALADVAGHGVETAPLGLRLRQLMRRHINELDQTTFLRVLNHEYLARETNGRFATALLASFHRPTSHLVVCNAGHPRPLWYRSAVRAWQVIDFDHGLPAEVALNLPLGIVEPTNYRQFAFPLSPGDLVVLYSDGYTESTIGETRLGERGLLAIAQSIAHQDPESFGRALNAALADRTNSVADDDQTLMVIQPTFEDAPPLSTRERLTVLGKMIGVVPV
jgi:phosphoserine phosphatase RsbU/P